ncbi:MAG TPA: hypothetical protein VGD80_01480 [Kofleriaceae bacterium]
MSVAEGDAYMFNPFARLRFEQSDGEPTGLIRVSALLRGRGWQHAAVAEREQPGLHALLRGILIADGEVDVELTAEQLEALQAIGLWIAREDVPRKARFCVALDACDAGAGGETDDEAGEIIVHPGLQLERPARLIAPPAVPDAGSTVWITDARTGVAAPYWTASLDADVRRCSPGAPPPPLAPAARAQLRRAGVLVTTRELERAAADRARELTLAAEDFARNDHAVLPGLVPAAQLGPLQRYYRALIAEGFVPFGDSTVPRRYAQHNERVARVFLAGLHDAVQTVVRADIKPAYAYFASYREGAELPIHVDRAQCELSISLLVDYEPAIDGSSPWPLWLHRTRSDDGVAVHQRIGDGIVYRGRKLYHSRTALPEQHRSTHLFLHYVYSDFEGSLD